MSSQTNISFYTEGDLVPSPETTLNALRTLGVDENLAFVTKYKTLFNAWEHRFEGSLPEWEFNRRRIPLTEAVEHVDENGELLVSVITADTGLGKRLILDAWQAVPDALASGCIIGNNGCTIGMHDVFGMVSQVEEKDTYIARSPFSFTFWGYRCPKDIDQFREIVEQLPIVSEVADALSHALNRPIKTAIYMNL